MTAMTNIKSMISKRSANSQEKNGSPVSKKNSLKDVINAANLKQEASDQIEALAIAEEIENQMVRDIAKEIDTEFNLGFDKNPNSIDLNGNSIHLKLQNSVSEEKSERVLELQRKQTAMQDIHLQMRQGSAMLETLVKKSEQISDYLSKAEIELCRLEDVETRYKKLHLASETLAKEHRELKSRLEEKYKQVNLLEGQKHKTRDMLDKAQLEINRLVEQSKAQTAEMHSQDIVLSKLKDENLSVNEKNNVLGHELAELTKQNKKLQSKLEASYNELAENDKAISKSNMKIEALTRENEQTAIDSLDIQARYASLNEKYAEGKSLLEEVKYELSSERSSFDEKLRLKDTRIMKMERKIEVLTRQVSLTEQMVTDINDEKTAKLGDRLLEMKQPYCKNPSTKNKASRTASTEASAAI